MSEEFPLNIPVECFQEICRVCLLRIEPLYLIPDILLKQNNVVKPVEELMLGNILQKYCDVMVHKDDFKPQKICNICLNMVAQAYNIFEVFRESNGHLDTILGQHALKLANKSKEKSSEITYNTELQTDSIRNVPKKDIDISTSNLIKPEPVTSIKLNDQPKAKENNIISTLNSESDDSDHLNNVISTFDSESNDNDLDNLDYDKTNNDNDSTMEDLTVKVDRDHLNNVISTFDSESDNNDLDNLDYDNTNTNNDSTIEDLTVKVDLQFLWEPVEISLETQGFINEVIKIEPEIETESTEPVDLPSVTETLKMEEEELDPQLDHTNYVNESESPEESPKSPKSKIKINKPRIQKLSPSELRDHKKKKMMLKFIRDNDIFYCKFCEKTLLKGMDKVIEHMKSVHPVEEECLLCPKKFSNSKLLLNHVASHAKHLVCKTCEVFFKDRQALEAHNASDEHKNNIAKCEICNKIFSNKRALAYHVRAKHVDPIQLGCKKCAVFFEDRQALKAHNASDEHKINNSKCEICNKIFSSRKTLSYHVRAHANSNRLVCRKCAVFFKDRETFDAHNASDEHKNNTTKCEICNKIFSSKRTLGSHVRAKHKDSSRLRAQCPICGYVIQCKYNMNRHMNRHKEKKDRKTFLCDLCANGFTRKISLKMHVLNVHEGKKMKSKNVDWSKYNRKRQRAKKNKEVEEDKNKEVEEDKNKEVDEDKNKEVDEDKNKEIDEDKNKEVDEHPNQTYQCDYCPKLFQSHATFFKHRLAHPQCRHIECQYCDGVFDTVADYQKHRIADHRNFVCGECQKGFASQSLLYAHNHNIHKNTRKYLCSLCLKHFKTAQQLTIHQNAHNKVKPYACQICDKRFVQLSQLSSHEACMHERGKKNHECTLCDKSFLYNSALQVHIRTHTGFKPFTCPYCKRRFTNTTTRHKHVKRDHSEKWAEFEIFKKENQSQEAELAKSLTALVKEPEPGSEELFSDEDEEYLFI